MLANQSYSLLFLYQQANLLHRFQHHPIHSLNAATFFTVSISVHADCPVNKFPTTKPDFPQGSRDANLTKNPKIRKLLVLIFLSLKADIPSPHAPYSQTDPPPHIFPLYILSPVSSLSPSQDLSLYKKYTRFYLPDNPIS